MLVRSNGYVIIHYKRCSAWDLLLSLLFVKKLDWSKFCDTADTPGRRIDLESIRDQWRVKLSLFLAKLLDLISRPLATLGDWIEFWLNLMAINGGLLKTMMKYFTGNISMPRKGSETYFTINGLLERRVNLVSTDAGSMPSNLGDRFYADLCAMASTLAYENGVIVRYRVSVCWKMHFVNCFDCWVASRAKNCTSCFIFCDREVDARVVVVAFRGTRMFDADDWKIDFDLSWYKIPNVGKVHMGFMEALGMANRHEEDVMKNLDQDPENSDDKPLAYYTLVQELQKLFATHKKAKLILTGHSLGGSLAVVFSSLLIMKNQNEIMRRLTAVYTYGQPRVGDAEFGRFMEAHLNYPDPRLYRFVYCNDLPPRFPLDDDIFQFKHFGTCLYFSCFYIEKNYEDEPNRNFSILYFVPVRLNSMMEMVVTLFLPLFKGADYRETKLLTAARLLFGLLAPGLVDHCMTNYVNSARLGPSTLGP